MDALMAGFMDQGVLGLVIVGLGVGIVKLWRAINSLNSSHEKRIEDLQSKHAGRMAEVQIENAQERKAMREQFEEKLNDQQIIAADERKIIRDKFDVRLEEFSRTMVEMSKETTKAMAEITLVVKENTEAINGLSLRIERLEEK
jgi:DNA-binding transcriptional regulator YiaG